MGWWTSRHAAWLATGGYVLLTVFATWPLAAGLTRDVPGDFGDPLFVMWVLGSVMQRLTALARGQLDGFWDFWDANIFHPEPLTLAYSDHFVAQAVFALPVYWASDNLILCYNVAFMTTFVLAGLGTFLLARELTGHAWAAFFAGVVFAFSAYRLDPRLELSHLQVLSAQWMPFTLYGLHRYFQTGSRVALAGAGASFVAVNLSALYFMLFFPPFVAACVLFELARRRELTVSRRWLELASAAAAAALVTWPFVLPYLAMERLVGFQRSVEENIAFSARVSQYADAASSFLAVPFLLTVVGAGALVLARRRAAVATRGEAGPAGDIGWFWLTVALTVVALWLALGLRPSIGETPLPALYRLLWDYVPGYQGLRAPSRLTLVALLFLSLAAAYGLAMVARACRRLPRAVLPSLAIGLFLTANVNLPLPLNAALPVSPDLVPVPRSLAPAGDLPGGYQFVARLPVDSVIAELPFGDLAYEIRYTHFAARHRRAIVNGYSGLATARYGVLADVLRRPFAEPGAWEALLESGATHVNVHHEAWVHDGDAQRTVAWLVDHGALPAFSSDAMTIYELPRQGNR